MIHIEEKQNCCGCGACVQICPKHCIKMYEDDEGFLYPTINMTTCIDCGLCETVCPVIHVRPQAHIQQYVYAAFNPNEEIRLASSSGGIFTMLAEKILEKGGVVFGAGYNSQWEVSHFYVEKKEGLSALRMSKYVQSVIGNTYMEAKKFLKQGREVLFTGTPCQIAGLKNFLRTDYDNLYTMDFVCHGVPSPGVFRWYLKEEIDRLLKNHQDSSNAFSKISEIPSPAVLASQKGYEIRNICFRDKRKGWKRFSFAFDLFPLKGMYRKKQISYSCTLNYHVFLRGFFNNLFLRPSCFSCPVRNHKSGSDITIGDWWGIEYINLEMDDDKGVSAIICNSEKGNRIFNSLGLNSLKVDYDTFCRYNPSIKFDPKLVCKRAEFYQKDGKSYREKIHDLCYVPFPIRIRTSFFIILHNLLGFKRIKQIKKLLKKIRR